MLSKRRLRSSAGVIGILVDEISKTIAAQVTPYKVFLKMYRRLKLLTSAQPGYIFFSNIGSFYAQLNSDFGNCRHVPRFVKIRNTYLLYSVPGQEPSSNLSYSLQSRRVFPARVK